MSPKLKIKTISNVVSPKLLANITSTKISPIKKFKVMNTSVSSGLSPKSSLILDTFPRMLDLKQLLKNKNLTHYEKEELTNAKEIFFLGKISSVNFFLKIEKTDRK